jgi:hypothetical protein
LIKPFPEADGMVHHLRLLPGQHVPDVVQFIYRPSRVPSPLRSPLHLHLRLKPTLQHRQHLTKLYISLVV